MAHKHEDLNDRLHSNPHAYVPWYDLEESGSRFGFAYEALGGHVCMKASAFVFDHSRKYAVLQQALSHPEKDSAEADFQFNKISRALWVGEHYFTSPVNHNHSDTSQSRAPLSSCMLKGADCAFFPPFLAGSVKDMTLAVLRCLRGGLSVSVLPWRWGLYERCPWSAGRPDPWRYPTPIWPAWSSSGTCCCPAAAPSSRRWYTAKTWTNETEDQESVQHILRFLRQKNLEHVSNKQINYTYQLHFILLLINVCYYTLYYSPTLYNLAFLIFI